MVSNPKRGCGYLTRGSLYLRGEGSPDGILPPFVEYEYPLLYLEQHFRTYKPINGLQMELALGFAHTPKEYRNQTIPQDDIFNLMGRLKYQRRKIMEDSEELKPNKDINVGELDLAWGFDLLMWVGEKFYPTPDDFVFECRKHGLSKKIPLNEPPQIIPGITRLFIIHPLAIEKKNPGIIGYSYLTRAIYTKRKDGHIPKWIQDQDSLGRLDIEDFDDVDKTLKEKD